MEEGDEQSLVWARRIFTSLILLAILVSIATLVLGGTTGTDCTTTVNYTNCSAYGCVLIKDKQGATKAIFDGGGFIDLKGTVTPSSIGSPDGSDFIIKNAGSANIAWIDNTTGNMRLSGTINDDAQALCTPPAGSFVIRNSAGNCVSYIDNAGNIWSRGRICYNARMS